VATRPGRRRARDLTPRTVNASRLRGTLVGTPGSIAGTIYGTIVVMGAIAAGAAADLDAWRLAPVVVVTVVVLWIAHVYAHSVGESIERGRTLDRAELMSVGRRELAIPLAAVAPTAALLLGAAGVLREATAVWLAFGAGLAALLVQGLRVARLERLGRLATVASVGLNLAFGLVIVLLKSLVGH
jgi:hypothetical protein